MKKCCLDPPRNNDCCCVCTSRFEVKEHKTSKFVGWGCAIPFFYEGTRIMYLGDFEHGPCELCTREDDE